MRSVSYLKTMFKNRKSSSLNRLNLKANEQHFFEFFVYQLMIDKTVEMSHVLFFIVDISYCRMPGPM